MFSTRCIVIFSCVLLALSSCRGRNVHRRTQKDDATLLNEVRQLLDEFRDVSSRGKMVEHEKRVTSTTKAVVYLNGIIYTVKPTIPRWQDHPAEALVIEDGKISFVGFNDEAQRIIDVFNTLMMDFTVYDLGGSVILPGIHDVHMHPVEAGLPFVKGCELPRNTAPNATIMVRILENCLPPSNPKGTKWVLGGGHSITNILEHIQNGGKSPREILDEAIPYEPAIMLEETSHSCWVNSMALAEAGIDKSTPEKPGGIIMRGKNNEPNGILFENAVISMMDKALKPNDVLDQITYEGLKNSLGLLAQHGITSICDARVFWKRNHDKIWEKACKENDLSVRAVLGLWAYPDADDAVQIQKLENMYSDSSPECGNLLRKTQIKVYSDGLLESTTAAMLSKYNIDLHLPGNVPNVGMNYFNQNRLAKYVRKLQQLDTAGTKGFDFLVHTIGDRGIRETLNAIQESHLDGERHTRHRLTHVEVVHNDDIRRFVNLDVTADFQVAGDYALPRNAKAHVSGLIGPDRAKNFIPVRSIKDTGATTTFSSDWDVSGLNPFQGIQHALQRGNQSITLPETIEMYTIIPAYVMRQEDTVGSLEVGKAADLIVIDKDIFNVPVDDIHKTKVLQTLLAGREVYRMPGEYTKLMDVTGEYIDVY